MITRAFAAMILGAMLMSGVFAAELEAEVKVPAQLNLTAEQMAAAAEAKKAALAIAAIEKEMQPLYKNYKANKDAIRELSEKMRPLRAAAQKAGKLELGLTMEFVIKNTGKDDATLKIGGDESQFAIKVTGPDAYNMLFKGMMTMDHRMGAAVTIKSGGTHTLTIQDLRYGKRNMSRWLIGAAGDYTIEVGLRSGRTTIQAKPATLKVVSGADAKPAAKAGPKPAIKEVKVQIGHEAQSRLKKVANPATPLLIESPDDAAKYFSKEEVAAIAGQIDFAAQKLLVFAWAGSGQDKLSYVVMESFPEQIRFRLTRGRTRDLRQHFKCYGLRKNVRYRVGK